MNPSIARPGPVLFFDGECGLCQRVVRLLLRMDRAGRLHFAPLQGGAAQAFLRQHGLPTADFESLVFVPDWESRDRPEYLLRTAGVSGRILAAGLAMVPASGRDAGYRAVGRWRYRVFGAWRPRPLARPEWNQRFLEPVEFSPTVPPESR